jgi:hypothetical protein
MLSPNGANDLVTWIEKSVDEFCKIRPNTGENHICDSLMAVLDRRHARKMERLKQTTKPSPQEVSGLSSWDEHPDPELDGLVQEVLKDKDLKQPVKRTELKPANLKVPDLEWNEKGPIIESYLALDLIEEILQKGDPDEFEVKLLEGKKQKATEYPQVFFTFSSARIFEKLCYRAKVQCPFHIYAGQNSPPDGA